MNHVPLIDSSDEEYSTRVTNIMKAFNVPLDSASIDLRPDLLDVQSIMREGKIEDLAKCIQNVLNYNLNAATNNSIRILDPSFVTLFHVAQFIIKFLLFWKTSLFNENVKLQNQIQELEKLRKDYQLKKLEARELRKQLSINLRSKNAVVSECSQCKKVFVNDTYLYAHHRRRHGDQPYVSNRSDIQFLQNQLQTMKQQLLDVQLGNSPSRLMKMKLAPETGCLESQEKYWKGRLNELRDSFEGEKERQNKMIHDLEIENARLHRKLNPEIKSVQTQTESSNVLYSDYFQPVTVEQSASSTLQNGDLRPESTRKLSSSIFPRWSLDECCRPHSASSRKGKDIIDQVDSFLMKYDRRKEIEEKEKRLRRNFLTASNDGRRDEVRKVISKLFNPDESSEELAEKLIRIYNKRGSLVEENSVKVNSDDDEIPATVIRESREDGTFIERENTPLVETCKEMPPAESNPATIPEVQPTEIEHDQESIVVVTKPKSKFFPFFKNIPTKIMKNYTKSRKVCAEVVEDKIINRLSHQSKESDPIEANENNDPFEIPSETKTNERTESELVFRSVDENPSRFEDKSSEIKLVSALKKSKSTGNLAKRVMFADDLPNVRTSSASELSRSAVSETRTVNTVVGTIDVHYDEFALPVPAPRARKNIVSAADTSQ